MDPLTHIVIGRAVVAAARDERRNRSVGAAAVLGALAPDADSALAFAGWDRYVRAHQFGTHSLIGAVATAALAALIVDRSAKAFALRQTSKEPRRMTPEERSAKALAERFQTARFQTLFAAAAAGAMSHIALDLLSGARIAIAWPLVDRRVSLPLMAMADPWFVAIAVAWLLMIWPMRVRLPRASQIVVAAAIVFLCAKAALLGIAVRRSGKVPQTPRALEARWASLTEWYVFDRLTGEVRSSVIAANRDAPTVVIAHPVAADTALVAASRALEDVRNFVSVHEFAFADEARQDDGRTSVLWSDIRYCWPAATGEPGRTATHCGVRVGGVFDSSGRAIGQEIWIGSVVQRRN